jgi:hypothetical protein
MRLAKSSAILSLKRNTGGFLATNVNPLGPDRCTRPGHHEKELAKPGVNYAHEFREVDGTLVAMNVLFV